MNRRQFVATASMALFAQTTGLQASTPLPAEDLKILLGYPAGGAADFIARLIAAQINKTLGRSIIIVNQPGASGLITINNLRRGTPDGKTVALIPITGAVMMPLVKPAAAFDSLNDVSPIVTAVSFALGFVASNSTGIKTWNEFQEWAKKQPGEVLCGGPSVGSISHLFCAMMKQTLGINFQYVPYRGSGETNQALMGGHLPFAVNVTPDLVEPSRTGRLQVLAMSSKERDATLPSIPTFVELGFPSLHCDAWFGFFAPPGLPVPMITAWNEAINHALADAELQKAIQKLGYKVRGGLPAALKGEIESDQARWKAVVTTAGIKMD